MVRALLTLVIWLLTTIQGFAVTPTEWPYSVVCSISAGDAGGSGTLIGITQDGKGIIATAAHVVEGTRAIRATFPDGYKANGTVIDRNENLDLAACVILVKPGMQTPRGLRANVREGELVTAYGYPYYSRNLEHWTQGKVEDVSEDTIKFLAKPYIHSGFSGGCLLDKDGYYLGSTNGYGKGYCYAAGGPEMVRFFSKWVKVQ